MASERPHQPVLYQETIEALAPKSGGRYIDGTLGAGGHARGILDASRPDGQLLGLDVDPSALALAAEWLDEYGERVHFEHASHSQLAAVLKRVGWPSVDGILLDLGASSMQFDQAERGFSFRQDGPLDMRFDPDAMLSAADLVNGLPAEELAQIIRRYGEEKKARRIAEAIVAARPIEGSRQLADIVAGALGVRRGEIHPATRTFQALRIAVNDELDRLEITLPQSLEALAAGGRLAVISFHSLEDRIVKEFMRRESRDCICPPEQPVCTCGHTAQIKELVRKPIRPSAKETEDNPRARSARLRIAEKL